MKLNAKDFFLELSVIVVLYFLLFNLVFAVFTLIDLLLFDGSSLLFFYLEGDFFKFNIASLLVLTPAFWFLHRLLKKELVANPEKKTFWLRKWSLALTSFISAAIFIVTLISLVYRYLSASDFTANFLLKSIFVLVLFSSVLYYFSIEFKDAWQNRVAKTFFENIFFVFLTLVSITSLIVLGNPQRLKSLEQDFERVYDLQSLKYQISHFYEERKVLPQSLAELKKTFPDALFKDPVSGVDYRYKKMNDKEFELCAKFDNDFPGLPNVKTTVNTNWKLDELRRMEEMWKFKKGETCFKFNVDELSLKGEFYPKPVPIY